MIGASYWKISEKIECCHHAKYTPQFLMSGGSSREKGTLATGAVMTHKLKTMVPVMS
jgi:hypothetical protein